MNAAASSSSGQYGDRVSLERLVTALEQANVWFEARGDRVYFRCPLPDHPDEGKPSASADWHPASGSKAGQVRFCCHRCGPEANGAVLAELGLRWSDLYDDPPARPAADSRRAGNPQPAVPAAKRSAQAPKVNKSAAPKRVPTTRTTRTFTDAEGVELFRLHRYDPIPGKPGAAEADKGFSWEHRGGPRGGWRKYKHCKKDGDECRSCRDGHIPMVVPLYRLPEVTAAVAAGHRVWITEGGKNADALAAVLPDGEVATTAPDGARAPWSASYTEVLAAGPNPQVTIVADRDDPGCEHAEQITSELRAAGVNVTVVRTPLERKGADASDHLDEGLTLADFELLDEERLATTENPVELSEPAPADVTSLDEVRARHEGNETSESDESGEEQGGDGGGGGKKKGAARLLLDLTLELYEPLWTTTDECYVIPRPGKGPRVARPLRGGARSLSAELVAALYDREGRIAPGYAVTDSMKVVQGIAQRSGTPVELANRVARTEDGSLVLDLGDETGRAVVVTEEGWRVADESPVLFKRTARTGALPVPERGGDLDELWNLVHVRERDRGLAEAELVHRYFANVSHPLLYLRGEAGTGKTTAAETITGLVDPAPAVKVSLPNDPKDWAVQVGQAYSLVLDNVTGLQQWQSDALCMAVTGGHTVYRALYTDGGLAQFGGQQCLTLTSVDMGSQKADLTTRMLPIELTAFASRERMSEEQLRQTREESRPRILGALLDRAASVLDTLEKVDALNLELPRLSDFARTCKALDLLDADRGVQADRYGDYLRLMSAQAGDVAAEDEVAIAITELMARREAAGQHEWSGTAKELHSALGHVALQRSKYWPETPIALGKRVSQVIGPLREEGIEITRDRDPRSRTITLRRVDDFSSAGLENQESEQPAPAPEPESAATSALALPVEPSSPEPCSLCAVPGPSCGWDSARTVREDCERPCVQCGHPTKVRSQCGAPRHGECGGGGSEPPSEPGPSDPNAGRTSERSSDPQTRSHARTEPRRGRHLYGVLDETALTIVRDRRAGMSEPLENTYPSSPAEALALARRHDLEVLWVHDSALPRWGVSADAEESPEGFLFTGWDVFDREEPDEVKIAVPVWLTSTGKWAEAETGRELAEALAAYEAGLGMRWVQAPAASATALLGMLHNRHGARRLITPTALPARDIVAAERDLAWCRPLTEDERAAGYVIGLDKHQAYPSVMKSLNLGMGDPTHYEQGHWDPKLPGRHRIANVQAPQGRSELLPDPLIGLARDREWRCTETLVYAAEAGAEFDVVESYVWHDKSTPLFSFQQRIYGALAQLEGTDPSARLAREAVKETYHALDGALSSKTREEHDNPGKLWRPDWSGSLIAKSRVNMLRNMDKATVAPFAANVDELLFAVDDPTLTLEQLGKRLGLTVGGAPGQYEIKHAATSMDRIAAGLDKAAERGRPMPLLTALAELEGEA